MYSIGSHTGIHIGSPLQLMSYINAWLAEEIETKVTEFLEGQTASSNSDDADAAEPATSAKQDSY